MFYRSAEDIYSDAVTTITEVDISEGSLIYNAMFPMAMQLSYALMSLDELSKQVYASTAYKAGYSKYLELRANEVGIDKKLATYANVLITVTGKPNALFEKGSIVSTKDNRMYVSIEDLTLDENGTGKVIVAADKSGSRYNVKAGDINYLPIKYTGIVSVTNEEEYTDAYDDETDKDLYARYLVKVRSNATSGNTSHYYLWAMSVKGVGSARIYECTNDKGENENGCVLCNITSSNHEAASEELIKSVKDYIETQRPVGAKVYVISATELPINIECTLVCDLKQYDLETIKVNIQEAIRNYFADLDDDTDINYVSYAKLNSVIFNSVGVIDVRGLTVNGGTANIDVAKNEVAVLNELNISEL